MDVARLNFSHGTHQEHKQRIFWIKKARKTQKKAVAIMVDTQGPKIRVDHVFHNSIKLKPKDRIAIKKNPGNNPKAISIHPMSVLGTISEGMKILFNDGYLICKVVKKKKGEVILEVENPGVLSLGKGVNIPNVPLNLPAITEEDKEDLRFAAEEEVDLIAASFIRSSEHILSIKSFLSSFKKPEILVIAKIENSEGVENFESILQVADGIMVARGDLGVEMDLGEIPRLQKKMIRKCYEASKPVITATQMLESMISNPRPTRAEVSDVANAIYDSTSAVMLSAETAAGNYALEAVNIMKDIILRTEKDFDYKGFFENQSKKGDKNVSTAAALAAGQMAYTTGAKVIFAFTSSGFMARLVSRLRLKMPIIALTNTERNFYRLAINWGITPLYKEGVASVEEAFSFCERFAKEQGYITFGDLVVVTAGSPFGITGSTNTVLVQSVGDILLRAKKGYGKKVVGKVAFHTSSIKRSSFKNTILVTAHFSDLFEPILKEIKGIILDNHEEDVDSQRCAISAANLHNLPLVVQAQGAVNLLKEGEKITLDPSKALIYKS